MLRNRRLRARRLCLALAVVLCSALARGDALAPEARESRRAEIARKSESERARLQRNFKAFRELPAAEQEWLREFSRLLKEDDRGEGKLRQVMNDYYDWLSTLTPGQREDLRREADPNHRDKLVHELLKKQQELADATGAKTGVNQPRRLSEEDLDAVITVVEQAIHRFLSPEEIEQLKKKHGYARHRFVIDLAFPARPRAGTGPLGLPQWWSNEVLDSMVSAVTNPPQHNQLKNRPAGSRLMLMQLMIAAIKGEYEVAHEKLKPDQETAERFFVQLSSAEQDEIMRLPFDQQQKKLVDMYMMKKSAEDPDNFPQPPSFPGITAIQKQVQRANAGRPADPPRPADADAKKKAEEAKKKNAKGKGKAGGNKAENESSE